MDKKTNTYEGVQTTKVTRLATNIQTGEKFPVEILSDYHTVYTGMTEGSEVNKIKNGLNKNKM